MNSQHSVAESKCSPTDRARSRIEKLILEKMTGRKIDGISFVEEILSIAADVSQLTCTPIADRGLRFELAGGDPFEVDLDGNRGKLRMLCARLAVLCQENGHDFMLYGGEGTIRRSVQGELTARWKNTTDQQEFTISAVR